MEAYASFTNIITIKMCKKNLLIENQLIGVKININKLFNVYILCINMNKSEFLFFQ